MSESWKTPVFTLAFLLMSGCGAGPPVVQSPEEQGIGVIERFDPRFDALVPAGAILEKLADGFDWSEGPVWIPAAQRLLFSDVPRNVVYSWSASEGLREFLKPSGYTGEGSWEREPGSNGLTLDATGVLVLCQHGDRQVARLEPDGRSFATVVSGFEGRRFNSPNDLVFDRAGNLYFTDPPYGLQGLNDSPLKELDFNGVFRLSPAGELTLLTRNLTFPNGIALSPDEKTLYVAVSDPTWAKVVGFPLDPVQGLGEPLVLHDFTPDVGALPGLPDGLKVDEAGNIWTTGPGGVTVLSPDGIRLGRLNTGVPTANCAWGDDGSSLYITADSMLLRIKTSTRGPLPGGNR